MSEEADRFRLDTLAAVERLKMQEKQLTRAIDRIEDEITSLIEVSVRLGIDVLPVADAPPLVMAIARAELASAILHVRRAARFCIRANVEVDDLAFALERIIVTGKRLPKKEST